MTGTARTICLALMMSLQVGSSVQALGPATSPSSSDTPSPSIAVYESQANATEYKGVYQQPLRKWLDRHGYKFTIIGDQEAADSSKLAKFDLVITTSCYIVPDGAAKALADYVTRGGHLIWIDSPARCRTKELFETLGIQPNCEYTSIEDAAFQPLQPQHFLCDGLAAFRCTAVGNPARIATGRILFSWADAGQKPASQPVPDASIPAVVVTHTGKGTAVLLNWIVWLSHWPQKDAMISNMVEWQLAQSKLVNSSLAMRLAASPQESGQEGLSVDIRMLAHSMPSGSVAIMSRLLDERCQPHGGSRCTVAFKKSLDDDPAWAHATVNLDATGMADGRHSVDVEAKWPDGHRASEAIACELTFQVTRQLAAAQKERAKLLRSVIGGTLADYDAEPRDAHGSVDLKRLFEQIIAAHLNTYDFLIWHAKTDWLDCQLFVQQAKKKGLKVWITLVPPSEPPPSSPFGLDYLRWADQIGKLAETNDNIAALVIDDFWSSENQSLFTPEYVQKLAQAIWRHNPKVALLATVYWETIGDGEFRDDLLPYLDGIVFPYADLESAKDLPAQLDACRKWLGPDKVLAVNVYATGSSGRKEKGPRTADYLRQVLTISREKSDAVRIYCLPKDDPNDYRFRTAAELYEKWAFPSSQPDSHP